MIGALTAREETRVELRPYQDLALKHIRRQRENGHHRLFFTLPTGTGKSVVLSQLCGDFDRVVALAHRRELVDQLAQRLERDHPSRSVGICMASVDRPRADLIVGTPQTLHEKRLWPVLDRAVDAVLIDEAHHCTQGSQYERIMDSIEQVWPGLTVIGCTATPFRLDKRRIQDVLPVCAFSRTIDDMQQEGWLCPFEWHRVRVEMNLARLSEETSDGERDYKEAELALEAERPEAIRGVIDQTVPLLRSRPTVVFGVSIAHAKALSDGYGAAGLRSAAIWGTMPKRDRDTVIKAWRQGAIQIVCNCSVLTEGFDFPGIAALVIARPTQSVSLYLQMLGRGSRPAPGKENCRVVDVSGNEEVDDARQIILSEVVSVDEDRGYDPTQRRGDVGQQQRKLLVKGPQHDIVYRWIRDEVGYLLPAAERTTLCLTADPQGSGLYQLAALQGRDIVRVSQTADTLWEQQRLAHDWLEEHAIPALSGREKGWHKLPPSEKQLGYLRSLDPSAAEQARQWTRVDVRDAITRAQVHRLARPIQRALWAAGSAAR